MPRCRPRKQGRISILISNQPLAIVSTAQDAIKNIAIQALGIFASLVTNTLTHRTLLCAVRKLIVLLAITRTHLMANRWHVRWIAIPAGDRNELDGLINWREL